VISTAGTHAQRRGLAELVLAKSVYRKFSKRVANFNNVCGCLDFRSVKLGVYAFYKLGVVFCAYGTPALTVLSSVNKTMPYLAVFNA
jgi:hypothetical protein